MMPLKKWRTAGFHRIIFRSLSISSPKARLPNISAGRFWKKCLRQGKTLKPLSPKKGLKPIADDKTLVKILDAVMAENPKVVDKIKAGDVKPIDFLIGQVMKSTKGKANAKKVKELITEKLVIP